MRERNWAGNVVYGARRLHSPASVEALQELVAAAPRIRALGSRHSFNTIADSSELVSLRSLPSELAVDRAAGTASCGAGLTYGELARQLHAEGLALANLGSLPHISVGGSVATATHGSGDRNGNLATAVAGLELVTSSGELLAFRRGDPDFNGLVVGLGALGVVTRVTLDVEPAYEVSQRVYEDLSWQSLDHALRRDHGCRLQRQRLHELGRVGPGSSGSSAAVDEARRGGARSALRRARRDAPAEPDRERRPRRVHTPARERRAVARAPAPFPPEFTPSTGVELQSEYLLPRRHARAAIAALRSSRAARSSRCCTSRDPHGGRR